MKKDLEHHLEVIKENSVDFISQEEVRSKLKKAFESKKPLKLKIGFDPTARDIHLGHTVLLRKLRKLQDLGHQVYLIIGDFTAKIGDPSGKTALRPVLSDKEIKNNASTYTDQAFKILDKKRTKVIYNSIWYKKMKLTDFLSLLSSYTMARILERDDFSKRLKENKPLTMLEVVYPLVQGYDSYKLEADIEFGGTDQKFNLIVGRHMQQYFGQESQAIVTMPILVGLDGSNKMSKSLDNYIGVTDDPKSMFGKIMSISDEVMWEYYRLISDLDIEKAKALHPKEAKSDLSASIVAYYYSDIIADQAKEEFERVFSQKKLPEDMPTYKAQSKDVDLIEVLHKGKIVSSKNEARRLLASGAISLLDEVNPGESKVIKEPAFSSENSQVVFKIGKKRFLKVFFE